MDNDEFDIIAKNGELVGEPSRKFRVLTTSYLASGGDSYPFPKFLSDDPVLFNRIDFLGEPDKNGNGNLELEEDLNLNGVRDEAIAETFAGVADFAPFGTEQDSLAEYLYQVFPTAESAFQQPDVDPSLDERIQNLAFREDTVISE